MTETTKTIDILLLGSGGREHALAKKLAESPRCGTLYIAPGNGGTLQEGVNVALAEDDPEAVAAFAREEGIGLVVIGPEAPLVAGVADAVRAAGIACFGPGAEGAQMEMETTQIAGIDDTMRKTSGDLAEGASLVIHEKIMTTGDQHAVTDFDVDLNGEGCSANVVSRSVAKDVSKQEFISHINGNCACAGHSECDAIIMDHASVIASPALTANSVDASLIHEAAIGKIAGEQLIKLMTLGLTEKEAEDQIVNGFLK